MKIKSVEIVEASNSVQYELVLKNKTYQSIITEGSVLDCTTDIKERLVELFDRPDGDLTEIGMIVIDTTDRYNKFLKKARFNSELDYLDNQTFKAVLTEHASNPKIRTSLKDSLGELTKSRLGIIVDGIHSDFDDVVERKNELESMGYDCMVCFVNVSLQEVIDRRIGTEVLNDSQVVGLWKESQRNISQYSELFNGNLVVVDGSSSDKFMTGVKFAVENFVFEPVENEVGQNITIRSKTVHQMELEMG